MRGVPCHASRESVRACRRSLFTALQEAAERRTNSRLTLPSSPRNTKRYPLSPSLSSRTRHPRDEGSTRVRRGFDEGSTRVRRGFDEPAGVPNRNFASAVSEEAPLSTPRHRHRLDIAGLRRVAMRSTSSSSSPASSPPRPSSASPRASCARRRRCWDRACAPHSVARRRAALRPLPNAASATTRARAPRRRS